jgi:hypothetical protein
MTIINTLSLFSALSVSLPVLVMDDDDASERLKTKNRT